MEPDLRSRILLLVERYPGLHLREIQRRADCSPMLAEYHLNLLEKLGLVTSTTHGRYRDFFPVRNEGLHLDTTDRRWLSMLRRPPILAIALALLEHGSLRPMRLASKLDMASSTSSYQVRVAADAGLVIQETIDGQNLVRLADAERVLQILQSYHPMPDVISDYAGLWSRVFTKPRPAPAIEAEAPSGESLPEELLEFSQATQTVYLALRKGPMTQKQLCHATGRARRTVYGALKQLEEADLVASHTNMMDTRQTKYWLKDEPGNDAPEPNP